MTSVHYMCGRKYERIAFETIIIQNDSYFDKGPNILPKGAPFCTETRFPKYTMYVLFEKVEE